MRKVIQPLALTTTKTISRGMTRTAHRAQAMTAGFLLLFPEIAIGLVLFDAARDITKSSRFEGDDPERGDVIQWVIVTAIGAAIAVTVGAIIFNKLRTKANSIDVTTPGADTSGN